MNNYKTLALALVTLCATYASHAAITFTGTAFSNAPGISIGDVGVLIFDKNNTGFESINLIAGSSITSSATYGENAQGNLFSVALDSSKIATNPVGALITLSGAFSNVSISNGVDVGDKFAFVVFENSTTTVLEGDKYTIWTDLTWVVKPDGTYAFNANPNSAQYKQFTSTSSPLLSKTVPVPEPSSFAALAGLAAIGFVASRRRRQA